MYCCLHNTDGTESPWRCRTKAVFCSATDCLRQIPAIYTVLSLVLLAAVYHWLQVFLKLLQRGILSVISISIINMSCKSVGFFSSPYLNIKRMLKFLLFIQCTHINPGIIGTLTQYSRFTQWYITVFLKLELLEPANYLKSIIFLLFDSFSSGMW